MNQVMINLTGKTILKEVLCILSTSTFFKTKKTDLSTVKLQRSLYGGVYNFASEIGTPYCSQEHSGFKERHPSRSPVEAENTPCPVPWAMKMTF